MQTSPRGAIADNVLLPRNFHIQIQISFLVAFLVAEIIFKEAVIDSSMATISFVVADITLKWPW